MRVAAVLAALAVLLAAAGCGGPSATSPESVVRAWSAALNRNDNEAAARFFAIGAVIVQNGRSTFPNHADAVYWNAALPCGGVLLSLHHSGIDVVAVFRLDERPHHTCDAPGSVVSARFRVLHGLIVVWAQTATPDTGTVI